MKKLTCISLIFLSLGINSMAKAEEISKDPETQKQTSIKRIGIEAGLGLNWFLPFVQLKASYRLPYMDNRWDVFLSQSAGVSFGPLLHITSVGAKYYFANNEPNPKVLTPQPFFTGSIGGAYTLPYQLRGVQRPLSFSGVIACIGIGSDIHIIDNLQLSGTMNIILPYYVRPEINLKVRF